MAFIKVNTVLLGDNPLPHCDFVLDAASDLADLPTNVAAGSTAIVADKGAPAYMLNASGEWKEL